MPGFLYFVAGAQTPAQAAEALRKSRAPHAVEDRFASAHSAQGPNGAAGMLVAPLRIADGGAPAMAYAPDAQSWIAAPAAFGTWSLGYERASPPGPADLARSRLLPGHPVRLGDGRDWMIPIARAAIFRDGAVSWVIPLPASWELGADGEWRQGVVRPQYRPLAAAMEDLMTVWGNADSDLPARTARIAEAFPDLAEAALAANYRLGRVEIAALGLLTTDLIVPFVGALLDTPGLEELAKKIEASGEASTSPGAPVR